MENIQNHENDHDEISLEDLSKLEPEDFSKLDFEVVQEKIREETNDMIQSRNSRLESLQQDAYWTKDMPHDADKSEYLLTNPESRKEIKEILNIDNKRLTLNQILLETRRLSKITEPSGNLRSGAASVLCDLYKNVLPSLSEEELSKWYSRHNG
ncbi:hypothetical protein IKG45_00665 [Candidatus Saccharibacteria bacterium]|nr:hypothetical protein [Candidatus Saccharibacteria bacterium]